MRLRQLNYPEFCACMSLFGGEALGHYELRWALWRLEKRPYTAGLLS